MNKEEIAKSIDEGLKILKQEPSFIFYPEEIKAIEKLKHHIEFAKEFPSECFDTEIKIVLNLISKLQKELEQEKEKNKKLNLENQALFESINCNDDNMLARKYQELQKELDSQKQGNKDLVKEGVKLSAKIVELEKELDKKDKVIDLMAQTLEDLKIAHFKKDNGFYRRKNKDELKEEFFEKVEEENE